MGAAPPMTPPMTIAHSKGQREGSGLKGPPGERSTGRPPPPLGRPCDPDRTRTPGGSAPTTGGGPGWGTAGRPQEGEQGGRGATPPRHPPTGPQATGAPAPTAPKQGGWFPLPPSERRARARPAPPPQPPAPKGTAGNKRARANAPGHRTDRAQRRGASTNRCGMGAAPPMTRTTPVTPALLPAQGRKRDGTRQSDPPPYWPPGPHKRGAWRTGRPPPQPAPWHTNATDPPHGGRTAPSQVGGIWDRTASP